MLIFALNKAQYGCFSDTIWSTIGFRGHQLLKEMENMQ